VQPPAAAADAENFPTAHLVQVLAPDFLFVFVTEPVVQIVHDKFLAVMEYRPG
jgi:hypothetical protein